MLQVCPDNAHLWTSSDLLKIPSFSSLFCHHACILHSFLRHHRILSVHNLIIFIQLMHFLWTVVALYSLIFSIRSFFLPPFQEHLTTNSTSHPPLSLPDNYFDLTAYNRKFPFSQVMHATYCAIDFSTYPGLHFWTTNFEGITHQLWLVCWQELWYIVVQTVGSR